MTLLIQLIDMYSLIVFAVVISSWIQVPQNNFAVQWLNRLTEPILEHIRRLLPPVGGLDFSPMILLVGLQLLKSFLSGPIG